MKTIHDIKAQKSKEVDELITSCLVFFAFSDKQFEEGKTPLQEGEKYVSIGGGGYMPKGKVQDWLNGWKQIEANYKAAIKANKARRANIAYELDNHEAYYTGSIEDTLDALGTDYTEAEVREVYRKEYSKQTANL